MVCAECKQSMSDDVLQIEKLAKDILKDVDNVSLNYVHIRKLIDYVNELKRNLDLEEITEGG